MDEGRKRSPAHCSLHSCSAKAGSMERPTGDTSSIGKSHPTDKLLKSRIIPKRVHSGIHPDPWHSSRSLKETLLERVDSVLSFAQLGISSPHDKLADVTLLRLL